MVLRLTKENDSFVVWVYDDKDNYRILESEDLQEALDICNNIKSTFELKHKIDTTIQIDILPLNTISG